MRPEGVEKCEERERLPSLENPQPEPILSDELIWCERVEEGREGSASDLVFDFVVFSLIQYRKLRTCGRPSWKQQRQKEPHAQQR